MSDIVILYYSHGGNTRRMANQIARGVMQIDGCEAILRTVPELSDDRGPGADQSDSAAFITRDELRSAAGLIVGSPTRFGNMAAPLKAFFDTTTDLWLGGDMNDKPAAVFTSTSSLHGGQESTLLTMMLPLLHHGMVMVGLPYTEAALSQTRSGGTPYGASHVSGSTDSAALDSHEKTLCTALGKRVATLAHRLAQP